MTGHADAACRPTARFGRRRSGRSLSSSGPAPPRDRNGDRALVPRPIRSVATPHGWIVAQALASRGSPRARNQSSDATLADARSWAIAQVRQGPRRAATGYCFQRGCLQPDRVSVTDLAVPAVRAQCRCDRCGSGTRVDRKEGRGVESRLRRSIGRSVCRWPVCTRSGNVERRNGVPARQRLPHRRHRVRTRRTGSRRARTHAECQQEAGREKRCDCDS
jgi:hypothetical protein